MTEQNEQQRSLSRTIQYDLEHLRYCIWLWKREHMPHMRSYRRAVCSRVIWHIRIAQSNLASWGAQS